MWLDLDVLDVIRTHLYLSSSCLFSNSVFLSVGSHHGGEVLAPQMHIVLRFMISQKQLAEFEYAKLGKITQVLGYLVILEPNSETLGYNGVLR